VTPDAPGEWVAVAEVGALPSGASLAVRAGAAEVAVFNVAGELRAMEGRCLHRGGVLADGMVDGDVVTCPLHWWRYDLRTGERLGAPELRLSCYPVRVQAGRVEVLVPAASPELSLRERLLAAGRDWQQTRGGP
jgi:NAD(P)H-dependent nitrite reductase small subunit